MTSDIVGIHGVAKHHSGRNQLALNWRAALLDGLEAAIGAPRELFPSFDIAYYGRAFLPRPAPGTPVSMGDSEVMDALTDIDDAELRDIVASARDVFGEEELADAATRPDMGYSSLPTPLLAVMRTLDRRFGPASGVLCVGVLRQVRRYLRDMETRAAVDLVIVSTAAGCRALVAHSLGSVVGYRYLQRNPGHGVRLFLTLGSPLGLRMVRDRLDVRALDVPHWVNIRDIRDPVACAGDLSTWWPQVEDDVAVNGTDAHAAERYLGKESAGRALLKAFPELAA